MSWNTAQKLRKLDCRARKELLLQWHLEVRKPGMLHHAHMLYACEFSRSASTASSMQLIQCLPHSVFKMHAGWAQLKDGI